MADQESPIRIANRLFTITDACIEIGLGDVSGMAKAYCPFGFLHADSGRSRAFKVYPDSNSAWCFACQEYFTPVRLVARENDWEERKAAEYILDKIGWVPPNFEDQWEALHKDKEAVDREALAEALKIACRRMAPDWDDRQFEPTVAAKLQQCIALVGQVSTEAEATEWLDITKQAMRATLRV